MPKRVDEPGSGNGVPDAVGQFETAMKELEALVQKMEHGELRLEESLQLFERGIALAQQCRLSLEKAELKVQNLLESAGDKDASA
ncbi:MAG: exodeoxyribonuclease VII small subunit [Nevskiaceae bacterium]|nr:MAG: exodeoxyribonuclease VII small subunit [Nevskiaceae bacterium]